jgi:predicted DNA binding CopG/RHH family protein
MKAKPKYEIEEEDDDTELWETRKLGASAEHAVSISEEEDKAIDDSLGLQAITMRLQKELVEQLKLLAKKEGLGYQPYIRQLLTRHVRDIDVSKIRESA